MLYRLSRWLLTALVGLACWAGSASADVELPSFFSDHAVLQADMPIPVWGWAASGEKVTVTLGEQSATATADAEGTWRVTLAATPAGGPFTLSVEGANRLEIGDVLVGEVWLGSGQSNMAMTVNRSAHFEEEKAAAQYPQIRMFTVARTPAETPQRRCQGRWEVCSPETVGGFSATAYFFGRELHKQLGVPVGLLHSSWGGTPIQSWTSLEAQQAVPELRPIVEEYDRRMAAYDPEQAKARYEKELAAWQEKADQARAAGNQPPRRPGAPSDPRQSPNRPASLYNGMIAPLVPYALRGAIWYQGEANAGGGAALYGQQLATLFGNWRAVWNQGDFPVEWVQLPNFRAPQQRPVETDGWVIVQEQMRKALDLPGSGMAITIDVGEAGDIHPKNKQEVGRRLALWALAKTYGKDLVYSGPLYKGHQIDGGQVVIDFDHAGTGLAARGDRLEGFAIAGADGNWVWADAKIDGNRVVVSSPEVPAPVAVRYAWASNPKATLVNSADLPASPFRTDNWEK